ncbi:MAG: AtpZ/AtpI family protein [Bacteroidales bacterium]|nr:AtpZ/AtpI family protein [Bacteroidales bacterium]
MKNLKKKKKYLDNYARYTSIAFQMLAIILAGVWGGIKLDQLIGLDLPVFTVILSVIAVIFSIYYVIKDFLRN